jgi:hypothetical protein
MAATSKKTTSKKSTKSSAAKPSAKTVSSYPTFSLSTAPTTTSAESKTISSEERQKMIEQAAYFRAEKRNFQGDPNEDWMAAEEEIDAQLTRQKIKVV